MATKKSQPAKPNYQGSLADYKASVAKPKSQTPAPPKKGDEPVRAGRAAKQKPLSGEGYIKKPIIYSNGSLGPSGPSDMGDDRAFRRIVHQARKEIKEYDQKIMALRTKRKQSLERKKGQ